jgi:hypothetical protein
MDQSSTRKRPTIAEERARATEMIRKTAEESNLSLPAGVEGLAFVPEVAPSPPPYGTRIGTWADAETFLREWAAEGRDWVNIGLRVRPNRDLYLAYEVPHRGVPSEPLGSDCSPSINFYGPMWDRTA